MAITITETPPPLFLAPPAKKRGRPCEVQDVVLADRRDKLLGVLEYYWAEFAWELQRAKTIAAVRKALSPILDRRELERFVLEPTEATTWNQLRIHRKTERECTKRLREAIKYERNSTDRLERAKGAMRGTSVPDAKLEQLCRTREQVHSKAQQSVQDLQSRADGLRKSIERQEAYIAQSELLDFVASKRYSFTPLNLANALAGLPFVTWRQSATRCQKIEARHPYELFYEMFQDVARALADPPRTAIEAVEQVRLYLLNKKCRNSHSAERLREDFYYLCASIDAAYTQKPRRTAMCYRVFSEYLSRQSPRTAYDQVFADEERLTS